jgi:ribosomal RNA-processing protein 7
MIPYLLRIVVHAFIFWSMQERKAKEALAAEGGWTVVVQKKGRKKTTDSESGIAVGSVAQAAAENKLAKKKPKEVGLDFYRFQKREAQRNGMTFFKMFFHTFIYPR